MAALPFQSPLANLQFCLMAPVSPEPPPFLDVPALLDKAPQRAQAPRAWFFIGGVLLVVMTMAYLSSGDAARVAQALVPLLMVLGVGTMLVLSFGNLRRHRSDVRQLEAAEELVQLRRWPEAAVTLEQLLSAPPRSPAVRVQGLIFLSGVLARYGRFNDAIAVQDYLLEHVSMDGPTEGALRVGRAMGMLREDHLFDADRAIAELRRMTDRTDAAGVALVEMYRDVKTGHPAEAIEVFEQRLPILRDKLGHRLADAYALGARAYDLLDRQDEARQTWSRATLLAPAIELVRRYPEVERTAMKYAASAAPAGM